MKIESKQKEPAIRVNNLSKSFRIPLDGGTTLKQKIVHAMKRTKGYREFTPINNITFTVNKGDFFGIVGKNGSGKSTLLKTIAGIYHPKSGGVEVNGILVPFIELGVGFNPELTGKENIYLNGALLGFSRSEIAHMYDEIVDFAELHDFMEERLKNYSSGMQVRLAFSIAIRAKGDILLLDEVLAVGDAAFQQKCYDYFEKLKRENRTIILVTHSMDAVKRFCNRSLLLEDGNIKIIGSPEDIANQYIIDNMDQKTKATETNDLSGELESIEVSAVSSVNLSSKDSFVFDIKYKTKTKRSTYAGFSVLYGSISVLEHNSRDLKDAPTDDMVHLRYSLPLKGINSSALRINVTVFDDINEKPLGYIANACEFHVRNVDESLTRGGIIYSSGEWSMVGKNE
jgi:ABC-2 type transport system ATP-binding protein